MDILNMEYINSLPQPFLARMAGGGEWEVDTICVETGLMKLNVCGMLDNSHISEVIEFTDIDGNKHDPDDFWLD